MAEPLVPSVGLAVLHLFCTVGEGTDRRAVTEAVTSAEADGLQVVPVAVLGHKADVAFMVLGPDLWRLRQLQTAVQVAGLDRRRLLRLAHRAVRVRPRACPSR
jgi:hydrogen peroxide-dependent heme synthase